MEALQLACQCKRIRCPLTVPPSSHLREEHQAERPLHKHRPNHLRSESIIMLTRSSWPPNGRYILLQFKNSHDLAVHVVDVPTMSGWLNRWMVQSKASWTFVL